MTKTQNNKYYVPPLLGFVWLGGSLSSLDFLSVLLRGRDLAPGPVGEFILWAVYIVALFAALAWRALPDRNHNGIPDILEQDKHDSPCDDEGNDDGATA